MSKKYKSEAFAALHETMSGLFKTGVIDKKTMSRFDASCLTAVEPLTPKDIKKIRDKEHVSQAVLARHLNVTTDLVSKWERGDKVPSGPSLKLLSLVKRKGLSAVA